MASIRSIPELMGDVQVVNPFGPGWANPATGRFDDPRITGRDGQALTGPYRNRGHSTGAPISSAIRLSSRTPLAVPVYLSRSV
jgi:hypothetical protein